MSFLLEKIAIQSRFALLAGSLALLGWFWLKGRVILQSILFWPPGLLGKILLWVTEDVLPPIVVAKFGGHNIITALILL